MQEKSLHYEIDDDNFNYLNRTWKVTAGYDLSNEDQEDVLMYYLKPEITSISGGVDMKTTGGQFIIIDGTNFGRKGLDSSVLDVEYGPDPTSCMCACPWRTSEEEERCDEPDGCLTDSSATIPYGDVITPEKRTRECKSEIVEREEGTRMRERERIEREERESERRERGL